MIFGSSIIMRWLDRNSKNSGHLFDIGKGGQERFCWEREITNRAISSVTQETTERIPWEDEQNYECQPRPCWANCPQIGGGVLMTVLSAFNCTGGFCRPHTTSEARAECIEWTEEVGVDLTCTWGHTISLLVPQIEVDVLFQQQQRQQHSIDC